MCGWALAKELQLVSQLKKKKMICRPVGICQTQIYWAGWKGLKAITSTLSAPPHTVHVH